MTNVQITVTKWQPEKAFYLCTANGDRRRFVTFLANLEFEQAAWVYEKIFYEPPGFASGCDLIKIVHCMGENSILTIGELKGVLKAGGSLEWMYPSGCVAEPEWFWEWVPNKEAIATMNAELDQINSLKNKVAHFKSMIPSQIARKHGFRLESLDLRSLPDLIRPGVPFVFEQANG